jgi:pectate lyase
MKLSILSLVSLALSVAAAPAGADFSLVGFAKDNPIGTTTGGAGKNSKKVTVRTVDEFVAAVKGNEPTIVYADGSFNLTGRVSVGSNKSLIGVGKGAQILGSGLNIKSQTNVIVRNFGFKTARASGSITMSLRQAISLPLAPMHTTVKWISYVPRIGSLCLGTIFMTTGIYYPYHTLNMHAN